MSPIDRHDPDPHSLGQKPFGPCALKRPIQCPTARTLRRNTTHGGAMMLLALSEGFTLTITEELAAGVPIIASDLPAHREAGGNVAEFVDPINGAGWRDAILDYQAKTSLRRKVQLDGLAAWHAPSWEEHLSTVLALAEDVAA